MAVKVLEAADERAIERFRRELEATARLRHPGIVAVHDAGDAGGRPFLVMDLVRGAPLDRLVRERPLEARAAAALLRDVARAVQHAHEAGVLHRDLKPQSIIVEPGGAPRVVDFGLARLADTATLMTRSGQALGTLLYMPPEQAAGDLRRIDARSDVYSLGATLYHALTGGPPFPCETAMQVMSSLANAAPEPPSARAREVSERLDAVVLRCLEKDPERRYPSAGALAEALDQVLAGPPAGAGSPGGPRARRWLVAATVLGGLVAGLAAWSVPGQRPPEGPAAPRGVTDPAPSPPDARAPSGSTDPPAARPTVTPDGLRAERARLLAERSRLALAEGRRADALVLAAHAVGHQDTPDHRSLLLAAREGPCRRPRPTAARTANVATFAFTGDGRLTYADPAGRRALQLAPGTLETLPASPALEGACGRALATSPEGRLAWSIGDAVRVWAADGRDVTTLPLRAEWLALSADGALLGHASERAATLAERHGRPGRNAPRRARRRGGVLHPRPHPRARAHPPGGGRPERQALGSGVRG